MFNASNVFDLKTILVDELIGDIVLFIIFAVILIMFLSLKNDIPFPLALMFVVLFFLIILITFEMSTIMIYVMLLVGFIFFFAYARVFRRG